MADESMAVAKNERHVRGVELAELPPGSTRGKTLLDENNELLNNVKVRLSVSVGTCELTVKDLLALKEDVVLSLSKDTHEPVDVILDGKLIARGHLVAVDDSFGVRISEIIAR